MPPRQPIRCDEAPGPAPKAMPEALPDLSLRRILVPFGFSDTSALLLRRIVPLAERTGAALHLLHVVEPVPLAERRERESSSAPEHELADAAQGVLNLWRDRIVRGRVPAFSSVRIGKRAAEIVARAEGLKADLVAMTTRASCASTGSFQPSTAERVIHNAHCPALTIPARRLQDFGPDYDGFPASSWKRLLMPVDFSASAGRALRFAAALSVENRAKLVLLNIMLEGPRSGGFGRDGNEDCRRFERDGKRRLEEWVKVELGVPLEFESIVWAGIPSLYAVPLEAKLSKVDLIVMPVRKGGGATQPRARSVRDSILRSASCPILSIREGTQ